MTTIFSPDLLKWLKAAILMRRLEAVPYNRDFVTELANVNTPIGDGEWKVNEFKCLDLPDRTIGKNSELWTDPCGFATVAGIRTIAATGEKLGYEKNLVELARLVAQLDENLIYVCVREFAILNDCELNAALSMLQISFALD
jgi:hypothetical protein